MESLSKYLISTQNEHGPKTTKARLTHVPDVDTEVIERWILEDANNPNRKAYDYVNVFNSKTCGSVADCAIQQGYQAQMPKNKRIKKDIFSAIRQGLMNTGLLGTATKLFKGQGLAFPNPIDTTPQEFEDN